MKEFIYFFSYISNIMVEMTGKKSETTEKKRGAWLTFWLILMLILNFFVALSYLLFNKLMVLMYPKVSLGVWYVYGFAALANVVFVIFLFLWKKWPFYAFCGITLLAFIMNLAIGLGILSAILGLLGPIILYLSMKSRWKLFK